MQRGLALSVAALLLAGCGDDVTPEEQAAKDNSDVALVERANDARPPVVQISPEPLLDADIERHDLKGEACSYAPGTSLGARVIAREADAFMKIDGEVERFAADPGARELPLHSRSLYNSKNYALKLEIDGQPADSEKAVYEGSVTLFDRFGRVVYEGTGPAQCGG
jgi:hypothetical protein